MLLLLIRSISLRTLTCLLMNLTYLLRRISRLNWILLNLVQEFAFRFFTTYEKLRLQKNSIIIRHLLILRWVDMYDFDWLKCYGLMDFKKWMRNGLQVFLVFFTIKRIYQRKIKGFVQSVYPKVVVNSQLAILRKKFELHLNVCLVWVR